MFINILLFLGCLKVVSVSVDKDISELSEILKSKKLYVEKYKYPHMTRQIYDFYEVRNIRYVNTSVGPYCLDFFNRLFYYEWK